MGKAAKTGKKVAAAPLGQQKKTQKKPLFDKTPKSFSEMRVDEALGRRRHVASQTQRTCAACHAHGCAFIIHLTELQFFTGHPLMCSCLRVCELVVQESWSVEA